MIESITPEQEIQLARIRDEWISCGLSTEPADRPTAEAGIRASYTAAGLEPPRFIIWLESPRAGIIGQAIAAEIITETANEKSRRENESEIKSRIDSWSDGVVYGQHSAGYYSYYEAMESLGVTGMELIHGQQQVARSAGWWWCFSGFAIVTERPVLINRDANGNLHSDTEMAIRYPDGWGFYAWHGRRVPEWVIMNPSMEGIAAEENTEIRRCAIESMGWDNFTKAASLTCAGYAADPGNPGQFLELYDVPEHLWGSPIRLLLCVNGSPERDGTRRRYGLTVPGNMSDPVEAAAWTYGVSAAEYSKLARRT